MNLFYMRDQMIATFKGLVIARMHSPQREVESRVAEFCLNKIGMPPIGRISGEGAYLEGGDFLPFGSSAFIGCGLRTTQKAIDQLMENDWLGTDRLMVVRDNWLEQEQMHLDTYFNCIDRDLVTLLKQAERQQMTPGREFGIISYNDTPLKEILAGGITTLSTDFRQMGLKLAQLIFQKGIRNIENPWMLNIRRSL